MGKGQVIVQIRSSAGLSEKVTSEQRAGWTAGGRNLRQKEQ